jgi:hypothetical protein
MSPVRYELNSYIKYEILSSNCQCFIFEEVSVLAGKYILWCCAHVIYTLAVIIF